MATAAQITAVERLVHESVAAVDALTPGALQTVLPALRAARDELRADLTEYLGRVRNGGDKFTAHDLRQALRSLEAVFDRVAELKPATAAALAKLRHTTGPLAIQNLDTEIQRLSSIFGGGMPKIPQINAAAILAKGDKLLLKRHESSAKRYAGSVAIDIKNQFAIGVAKGETFEQLITRLRQLKSSSTQSRPIDPGADAGDIADGLFRRHRWWAERLVRTEGMNAYNVDHDAAIEYANANRPDGDEEYLRRWDASADPRTCPLCSALDRTVTTIGGTFSGGIASPPRHPCCRCVVLAWLARWGGMKGEIPMRGARPEPKRREPPPKPEPLPPKAKRPELEPTSQLTPDAKAITNAVARGDMTAAAAAISAALQRRGLIEASTPNGRVDVSDDGLVLKNHSGAVIKADALREWNGRIQLSVDEADKLVAFSRATGGLRADELYNALDEHVLKIREFGRQSGVESKTDAERARMSDLQKYDGMSTLMHECLHGFSPGERAAYREIGGQIEEITTETMARVVTRDMFGAPLPAPNRGAYGWDISAAVNAIHEVAGKDHDASWEVLQRASERYKRRTQKYWRQEDVEAAFIDDVHTEMHHKQDLKFELLMAMRRNLENSRIK